MRFAFLRQRIIRRKQMIEVLQHHPRIFLSAPLYFQHRQRREGGHTFNICCNSESLNASLGFLTFKILAASSRVIPNCLLTGSAFAPPPLPPAAPDPPIPSLARASTPNELRVSGEDARKNRRVRTTSSLSPGLYKGFTENLRS